MNEQHLMFLEIWRGCDAIRNYALPLVRGVIG